MNYIVKLVQTLSLKKRKSKVVTGIIPLSQVKCAMVIIDVEDSSWGAAKEAAISFFKEHGIKLEIIYFDFRKMDSNERLMTSVTNTILRKDLNLFSRPRKSKLELMKNMKPDLLISLVDNADYPVHFTVNYCQAKFKIGRVELPEDLFNFVFKNSEKSSSQLNAFKSMCNFIEKIK